jgi:hypothetical protein
MIDLFCGLVCGGLRPEPSLGPRADNVIISLDLTQLFCPGFTLAAGPPSGFTTNGVGCWGGALWRAFILTMSHWSSGLPVSFPSQGPRFKSPGGYLCETGILLLVLSRYIGDPDVIDHHCGLIWGGPRPEPSLGPRADNLTWVQISWGVLMWNWDSLWREAKG